MKTLTRSLGWSFAVAQAMAFGSYAMTDATLSHAATDTLTRAAWALAAWLGIVTWHSFRAPRPTFSLAPSPTSEIEMVRAWLGRTPSASSRDRATPAEIRAAIVEIYGRPYMKTYELSCASSSPEDLHAVAEELVIRRREIAARGENVRLVWPMALPSRGAAYDFEARRPRWMAP